MTDTPVTNEQYHTVVRRIAVEKAMRVLGRKGIPHCKQYVEDLCREKKEDGEGYKWFPSVRLYRGDRVQYAIAVKSYMQFEEYLLRAVETKPYERTHSREPMAVKPDEVILPDEG